MAIRRRFASVPPVLVSKRSRSYEAMPARVSRHVLASPASRADKMAYDTRAEDFLNDRVTNASFFSSYALDEGYDTARKSRNRDARLLREATDAIVGSESYATPQASVAARRVARGLSVAPRGVSMPPRATSVPPRPLYPEVVYYPKTYAPMYEFDPLNTTTTEGYYPEDYYPQDYYPQDYYPQDYYPQDYYRDLSYTRRPVVVYPRPRRFPSPGPMMKRKSPDRARSVSPILYFREEQRRKIQAAPVFDDWRRTARAKSVPAEVMPISRPWFFPMRRYPAYFRGRVAHGLPPQPVAVLPLPTEGLRAHKIPRRYLTRGAVRTGFTSLMGYYDQEPSGRSRQREEEEAVRFGARPRVLASPLARATLARAWRHADHPLAPQKARLAYFQQSEHGFPLLFVPRSAPKKSGRPKAALIASKVEVDSYKGRRPRSDYAARKYRSMRRVDQENIYTKSPQTSGYYASAPPLPKMTERKAIRTDEGYTKPKNLLSWQYRLESIMKPNDLLSQPSSFGRIRQQVRAAQEGMDRHRQMLDRYLPEEGADSADAAARVLRKMAELEKRDPLSEGGKEERKKPVRSHEAPY